MDPPCAADGEAWCLVKKLGCEDVGAALGAAVEAPAFPPNQAPLPPSRNPIAFRTRSRNHAINVVQLLLPWCGITRVYVEFIYVVTEELSCSPSSRVPFNDCPRGEQMSA
jgi:hypothetical protein